MIENITKIYLRELNTLLSEISAFKEEENLWKVSGSIKNSAGNLCLHLLGNLNTYICKNLGTKQYIRDRPAEFENKNIPRSVLTDQLNELISELSITLSQMEEAKLSDMYPENTLGYPMTVEYFLIHLIAHLNYHLGQINYIRRVLE